MPHKLLPEDSRKIIKRLRKLGFIEVRTRGSHRQFKDKEGLRTVTVADHSGDMALRDIRSIIRQSGLTRDDFYKNSN